MRVREGEQKNTPLNWSQDTIFEIILAKWAALGVTIPVGSFSI
jgi:hypothetical protein